MTEDYEEIILQLRGAFIDDAGERLRAIDDALQNVRAFPEKRPDELLQVRRETHNLKGMGESFGFGSISQIAHRMEDYMAQCDYSANHHIDDIQSYVDVMSRIIENGQEPDEAETASILRSLPVYAVVSAPSPELALEILFLTKSRTLSAMVGDVVRANGCRIVNVSDPFQALSMACRATPDMFLTSAVLDGIKGNEVLHALRSFTVTSKLPIAILTSLDAGHADLADLPKHTRVIRLDYAHLAKDLARAVQHLAQSRSSTIRNICRPAGLA